jgi:arylsulfatase A-like enzyme
MFGIRSGLTGHGGTAADRKLMGENRGFRDDVDEGNLINIFRKAGMKTASISTFAERHSSYWFTAGFNEVYNVGKGGLESGEEVMPVILDWLDREGSNDNWLLHAHLWDPHTPYRAPEEFGNPFADEPFAPWITEEVFETHLNHVGPHSINEISMYDDIEDPDYPRHPGKATNLKELRKLFDGYDCGIRYADELIGQMVDKLKELAIYDDLAIIITSDHGENMGELGIYAEHATADYTTCRIPLIFKWPGGKTGHIDNGLHCNIDMAPTFADLMNIEKSPHWDGESFADVITEGINKSRESLVLSQLAHVCQRSAIFGEWLYIRTYHCGYHLFDDEMLFNIEDDPYEHFDVKEKFPEICEKGAKIILDWHDEMMMKSPGEDPLWTVIREGGPYHTKGALDNYIKRLRATGRSEGADKLEAKYKSKTLM